MRTLVLGGTVFVGHAVAARRWPAVTRWCAPRVASPARCPAARRWSRSTATSPDGRRRWRRASTPWWTWRRSPTRGSPTRWPRWPAARPLDVRVHDQRVLGRRDARPAAGRAAAGAAHGGRRGELTDPGRLRRDQGRQRERGTRHHGRPGVRGPTGPDHGPARRQSDRFGYWPGRFARGGQALVPRRAGPARQHIDVATSPGGSSTRVSSASRGTYDGVGPGRPLDTLLPDIAAASVAAPNSSSRWHRRAA